MKNPAEKKSIQDIWETQEIRFLVLFSLAIQASLTFVAPFRKNRSDACIKFILWMLYLVADVVAVYAIGQISNFRGHHYAESLELLAMWSSFLLLHLGGPDTITALALEDNELWRRHALQLATQVSVTIYVFVRSFQYHPHNRLWVPTVLIFIDGLIKYLERTCALFFASRDSFRDSTMRDPEAGPNYARLMEEYYSATIARIPAEFQEDDTKGKKDEEPNSERTGESSSVHNSKRQKYEPTSDEKVQKAYYYYDMYKPLLAEGFLSLKNREESREFFLVKCDNVLAFEIIQIELNLIYDAFYTKSLLLSPYRAIARVLCFIFVIVSLVLFCLNWDLKKEKADAIVTFLLFGGAIALDICGTVMFVASDWWIIVTDTNKSPRIRKLMGMIPRLRNCESTRWSEKITKYNLLKQCFRKPVTLLGCICYNVRFVRDLINGIFYTSSTSIDKDLLAFIRKKIWEKAEQASDINQARKLFSARGNLVLEDDHYLASECLSPWTDENIDYDESLMIWHLATDICYWMTESSQANADRSQDENTYRSYSKDLSDYMLYLVIWKQSLLSSVVGMSETRFQDTCEEAKKFSDNDGELDISWFKDLKANKCCCGNPSNPVLDEESKFFRRFSERVLKVKAVIEPMVAKGDKSKSVLFDACRLAKQLEMFGEHQWEITSKVWLELLCYAAVRCSPRYHIAQLSKGGELITLVWLYMAHLGLGERFLKNQGFGSTKLVIEK